ncbi:MAG: nicotinate-nucleotide adenylyltransferase [Bacteroides sp.]|nr:nicotinate-nucleotide adenylyltransferase [Bacteroides sp.]
MQIGIFSGSFNPIHIGHLALANYLCEYEALDEVWFVVSPCNPFKQGNRLMPDELRLQLVQTAIAGYPKFRASDVEFSLPRPSYTINTLNELKRQYPEHTFHLIMGSDNWLGFPRWYKSEEILSRHGLLVYPRPGYPIDATSLPEGVRMVESPVMEISSTFIRQSLSEGKDIRFFLPGGIYEELLKHKNEIPG